MLIDTHSHIYAEEFDADRAEALKRAWDAGVEALLLPDIDSESRDRMFRLAAEHPTRCRAMAGLHPTSVNDNPRWQEELDMVEQLLRDAPVPLCGVGEIGLDLYWSKDFYSVQREVLHAQLELAIKYDKAVVIHTRDAYPEMLVGAGTVLTTEQVDRAVAAGAKFIVSPGLNPKVVKYCQEKNVPITPGTARPTDIEMALELGLDVVKSKIESLSGEVEVKNRFGEGSSWIIRLPLTLAIIQALMVVVGDEKYAIALGSIQTIEDVAPEEIKLVQAKEVIHIRGTVIPIIRLNEVLDIESKADENKSLTVIIVKKGDKQAGLVVDELNLSACTENCVLADVCVSERTVAFDFNEVLSNKVFNVFIL